MARYSITVQGETPLIQNKFTDEAALEATAGSRGATSNDAGDPKEECEGKLHKNEDGNPCIPQPMLFSALIEAGRHFKIGKKQLSTAKSSLVPGFVDLKGVSYEIESEGGWQTDTRPVRIPATGGRILRHRPMFQDWTFSFEIELDETGISPKLLRDLVDCAGKRIGIGDFRPSCKGPYGKFRVTHWEKTG